MKKIVFSTLSLFILVFTSCEKEDDSTDISVSNSDLIGTWEMVGFDTDAKYVVTYPGASIESFYTQEGSNFDYTLIVEEEVMSGEGSYDVETTLTSSGRSETETSSVDTSDISDDLLTANWELIDNDKILTTDSEGVETIMTIENISDSQLVLSLDLTEALEDEFADFDTGDSDLVFDIEYTGKTTLTFNK